MQIALVVGHKSTSTGADNTTRVVSEWEYNAKLAIDVWKRIKVMGVHEACVVHRRTYSTLPKDINRLNPKLVISMHCNAFNTQVSGTETLYYHRSASGEDIAREMQKIFVRELKLPDRGAKALTKEDKGGNVLAKTNAPAILCEPFFIDNDDDFERAQYVEMAEIYFRAILEACKWI
jgi:N-acetylmuramoyl-L-alanine amidase